MVREAGVSEGTIRKIIKDDLKAKSRACPLIIEVVFLNNSCPYCQKSSKIAAKY